MSGLENPRVVIINSTEGDWQGLYIDGSLVDEGHSLQLKPCLEHIAAAGIGPNEIIEIEIDVEGSLPNKFDEVGME